MARLATLTSPEAPAYFDYPAFSPDGRALAYASCNHDLGVACNVNVLSLDARLQPAGVSRRLPGAPVWIQGVAWTRDGRSIVYGVNDIPNTYLWRVRADGGAAPERVELAGRGGNQPSIARGRDRLAFTRVLWDDDIYRLQPGSPPAPVLSSTWAEWFPQYSPDGQRIVFASGRSGDATEVWLANADGSDATRLTRGPGRAQSAPRWSPDGRTIAFDSTSAEGRVDVWTIGVDGADLRQVTRDSAADNMPSFSRDGRLLYFGSNRTGRFEIWRVPVAGGAEEQLTHEGGCVPFESVDGRTLYYMRSCCERRPAGSARGGRCRADDLPLRRRHELGRGAEGHLPRGLQVTGEPEATRRAPLGCGDGSGSADWDLRGWLDGRARRLSRRSKHPLRPQHDDLRSGDDRQLPLRARDRAPRCDCRPLGAVAPPPTKTSTET